MRLRIDTPFKGFVFVWVVVLLFAMLATIAVTASTASAQIDGKPSYPLNSPIVLRCEVPKGVTEFAWNVPAPALSVVVGDGRTVHIWAPSGRYTVSAAVATVDWDNRKITLVAHSHTFAVGGDVPPGPIPPGPQPAPDVPPDEYGNIGQKVAAWVVELKLDNAKAVGANYLAGAKHLSGEAKPILPTIDLAAAFVSSENKKLKLNRTAWKQWSERIEKPWIELGKVDRDSAVGFLKAVAAGLGAK